MTEWSTTRSSDEAQRTRGSVLLITPLTFSYHKSICAALNSLGYDVTWWDERASSNTMYKIALRIFPRLTKRWSERHFLSLLRALDGPRYTHILVIKGEGLSRRVVREIYKALPRATMGLYLWDAAANVAGLDTIIGEFRSIATFDPHDARAFGWAYRPLFSRVKQRAKLGDGEARYDWSFAGTLHSDRHKIIHRLRRKDSPHYRTFVFGFFQSRLTLAMKYVVDWTLWFAPKGTLSIHPMTASEIQSVVAASKSVVDIEHPRQRGLTMRTIEALLCGKKVVTTNGYIAQFELFHPSRVHIMSRDRPDIPVAFLDEPFLAISDQDASKYECKSWVRSLLDLQDAARR